MMNGVRAFSDYKLSSLEFMRDSYLKDKNVGVLIGRGQKFNDEYQKEYVDMWLNEKMKEHNIDLCTNGADYIKRCDNGDIEESYMFEMCKNLDYEVIGVSHPNNLGREDKYLGCNTEYLVKTDGNGWGGVDKDGCPRGGTKTTVEMTRNCNKVVIFVVSGGHVSAEELRYYKVNGYKIEMIRLDSPAERVAKELGMLMEEVVYEK